MKKLILTITTMAFVSTLSLQASSKVEVITANTASIKVNKNESKQLLEKCKKKIGLDNYKFMKDIFNNENIIITKCKEALAS